MYERRWLSSRLLILSLKLVYTGSNPHAARCCCSALSGSSSEAAAAEALPLHSKPGAAVLGHVVAAAALDASPASSALMT